MFKSVVFSGSICSGKSTIARQVSRELGWELESIGDIWKEKYAKTCPETPYSHTEFYNFMRTRTDEENLEVNERMTDLVRKGNIVLESRYVTYLMDDPQINGSCLTLFFTANIMVRSIWAKAQGGYIGMPLSEIKRVLEKQEDEELRVGRQLWGIDYRDPLQYHAVIRSDAYTIPQKLALVMELVGLGRDISAVKEVA